MLFNPKLYITRLHKYLGILRWMKYMKYMETNYTLTERVINLIKH